VPSGERKFPAWLMVRLTPQYALTSCSLRRSLCLPGEIVNDVLHGFANAVSGWIDAVEQSKQESQTLAQLRDTLLPKLISGELRIADAERFIEERAL
jgi:hypothetical protein